jgi:hypothetical protein
LSLSFGSLPNIKRTSKNFIKYKELKMGNKIIWSLLILLISFAACSKSSKNNVSRQPTPQTSARPAGEQAEEDKHEAEPSDHPEADPIIADPQPQPEIKPAPEQPAEEPPAESSPADPAPEEEDKHEAEPHEAEPSDSTFILPLLGPDDFVKINPDGSMLKGTIGTSHTTPILPPATSINTIICGGTNTHTDEERKVAREVQEEWEVASPPSPAKLADTHRVLNTKNDFYLNDLVTKFNGKPDREWICRIAREILVERNVVTHDESRPIIRDLIKKNSAYLINLFYREPNGAHGDYYRAIAREILVARGEFTKLPFTERELQEKALVLTDEQTEILFTDPGYTLRARMAYIEKHRHNISILQHIKECLTPSDPFIVKIEEYITNYKSL